MRAEKNCRHQVAAAAQSASFTSSWRPGARSISFARFFSRARSLARSALLIGESCMKNGLAGAKLADNNNYPRSLRATRPAHANWQANGRAPLPAHKSISLKAPLAPLARSRARALRSNRSGRAKCARKRFQISIRPRSGETSGGGGARTSAHTRERRPICIGSLAKLSVPLSNRCPSALGALWRRRPSRTTARPPPVPD